MSDLIVRGLLKSIQARFVACAVTDSAGEICSRHGLRSASARVMSEAITGCALLGSILKGDEKITLQLRAEGKLRSLLADVDNEGSLRGMMHADEGASYAELMGSPGVMILTQSRLGKMVYQGTSELQMANLPDDLALHCSVSQQIESYMGVVHIGAGDDAPPLVAGLLLQALPDVNIEAFDSFRRRLEMGETKLSRDLALETRAYVSHLLRDFEPHVLLEKPLQHRCTCSKGRIRPVLLAMGAAEIRSLLDEQNGASVVCEWCGTGYEFAAEDLEELLERAAQH